MKIYVSKSNVVGKKMKQTSKGNKEFVVNVLL